jgi:hypothetical protein
LIDGRDDHAIDLDGAICKPLKTIRCLQLGITTWDGDVPE